MILTLNYNLQNYIDLIESGEIRACPEQHLGIKLLKKTFETEDIWVDEELAERYFSLEKYFPFKLFPWERYCFTIQNCIFRRDGFLRFPELHVFGGRGLGKNGFSSFTQFANSTPISGVKKYDIQTFAVAEDNAKQSFDELYNILENNKNYFSKYFTWSLTKIVNKKTGSKIYYGTSAAKSKDGGRQGMAVFDEIHGYENSFLIDVVEGGLNKVKNAKILKISSFGDVVEGPMDETVDSDMDILNGVIDDNGTYPFICRMPKLDMIHDEKNWVMACPSIEYLPLIKEGYRRDYKKYMQNPPAHLAFLTKKMGLRQGRNKRPVTSLENIKATNVIIPPLEGESCIIGLDYARLNDFAAAGFLFNIDEKAVWFSHSWVCQQSENLNRIKAPLKKWEAEGLLTFVDEPEISPEIITNWIAKQIEKHNLQPVVATLDSFRFTLMKKAFEQIGFDSDKNNKNNLKLLRPSDLIRTVPLIDSFFTNKKIIWGENPLMNWYVNNTMLRPEKRDEFSYGKQEPKSRKTDGFMAFAAAMTQFEKLKANNFDFDNMEVCIY